MAEGWQKNLADCPEDQTLLSTVTFGWCWHLCNTLHWIWHAFNVNYRVGHE